MIVWHDETLVIQGNKTTKDIFTQKLRDGLDELETFVEEKVLFGISLASIGISCKLHDSMDSGDDTTPGYGPFSSPKAKTLDNPDSDKFCRALAKLGTDSPCRKVGKELVWDRTKSMKWEADIHCALQNLYVQMHSTGGLAGRGTEEAMTNWTNEEFGSRRHLRVLKGTCGIDANYHKGALATGIYKNVFRLLPYRVARILFILLRVVRPVQLMALMKFCVPAGKKNVQKATALYGTRIFVSWNNAWTSTFLSSTLMAWFKNNLGFPMGLRMYRHFATALQRRYIRYLKHDNPESIQKLADTQAGRTEKTGFAHYAVEKNTSTPFPRMCDFEMVSAYWHEMCGYTTYPPDDLTPPV